MVFLTADQLAVELSSPAFILFTLSAVLTPAADLGFSWKLVFIPGVT